MEEIAALTQDARIRGVGILVHRDGRKGRAGTVAACLVLLFGSGAHEQKDDVTVAEFPNQP